MAEQKPQQISGYDTATTSTIISTCLQLATVLGDFRDDVVVVGGLVPYLLVDQSKRSYDQRHCGSRDVDLALNIALLNEDHYEAIANRLRNSNFDQDVNENNNPTVQRWRHKIHNQAVVDFLIDSPGKPSTIEKMSDGLGAIRAPGLRLAFRDRVLITLDGRTLDGASASREIGVCGAGAFLLLKSLAFHRRSEPKDAYDIEYILRYFDKGANEIALAIRTLLDDERAQEALVKLEENFETLDHNGPFQFTKFLGQEGNDDLRADCSGLVMELVRLCKQGS